MMHIQTVELVQIGRGRREKKNQALLFPISASLVMMGHSSDSGSALTASVVDGNRCDDGDGE